MARSKLKMARRIQATTHRWSQISRATLWYKNRKSRSLKTLKRSQNVLKLCRHKDPSLTSRLKTMRVMAIWQVTWTTLTEQGRKSLRSMILATKPGQSTSHLTKQMVLHLTSRRYPGLNSSKILMPLVETRMASPISLEFRHSTPALCLSNRQGMAPNTQTTRTRRNSTTIICPRRRWK